MREPLTIEPDPGWFARAVLLRLAGSLDGHGARRLIEACGSFRAAGKSVVLVMHDVGFISSSGVGALLSVTGDFEAAGLSLRIACPSTEVRMTIELLNLAGYLDLHDTENGALSGIAA